MTDSCLVGTYRGDGMDVFCTYNVQIQGAGITQPVDMSVELPEWLGDLVVSAQRTGSPDGLQQAALTLITARMTELYQDFMDDLQIVLTPANIAVRKLGSER